MRHGSAVLLASALSLSAVQVASTADIPVKAPRAPAAVVAASWTGCYIGVSGGGTWGRSRHDNESTPGTITGNFNVSGGIVGGTAGCNYQNSAWVVGVETDFSWTNKKGSATDLAPFNTAFVSETKEHWLGTVRGRVGHAWGDNFAYVTGGFAYGRVEIAVTGPTTFASEAKNRTGWTAGAGFEHMFTPHVTGKVEYLYVDLGNNPYFNPAPAGFSDRAGGVRLYDHIVRAGLNWKF
jgi:outer membrane immunogenic protein